MAILKFQCKRLRRYYEQNDGSRLPPVLEPKIGRILARLDVALVPSDMDLPGFRLHPLQGALKDYWAVSVSGNWRVIFRFSGGHAMNVDLVDYH
jgi:proteic killer suppression protein